jgi:hypothetical protein
MANYAGTLKDERGNNFYPRSANDHKIVGTTAEFFSDLYCHMFARNPSITGHLALKVGNVKQSNENFMITVKGHFFNYTGGVTGWEASCYFKNNGTNTAYENCTCKIDNRTMVKDIHWATGTDGYVYLVFTNGGQQWSYTTIYIDKVYVSWSINGYQNLWSGWETAMVSNMSGFTVLCTCQHVGDALAHYPIGSIYMSTSNTNPTNIIGGTWERIKGRFLLAADDSAYKIGSTGGEATHKLTIDEMPSHTHPIYAGYGDVGSPTVTTDSYRYQYWGGNSRGWKSGTLGAGATGGSKAHNNMPPYYAVYIWRRTA